MNPNYTEFKFPQIKAHPWHKVSFSVPCWGFFFYSNDFACYFHSITSSLSADIPQAYAPRSSRSCVKTSSILSQSKVYSCKYPIPLFQEEPSSRQLKWILDSSRTFKNHMHAQFSTTRLSKVPVLWIANGNDRILRVWAIIYLYCISNYQLCNCFLIVYLQLEACVHPFFDQLRDPNTRLPNGRPLPPLFNFKPQGLFFVAPAAYLCVCVFILCALRVMCDWNNDDDDACAELKGATFELLSRLIPEHARKQCAFLAT